MINPFDSSGTRFYISASLPSTLDSAGFSALTYTQIRGMRSVGDIGEQSETIVNNVIGEIKQNIIVGDSAKTLPLEVIKIDDAGQTAIKLASRDKQKRSYKIIQPDNTTFYFTGTVSAFLNGFTGLADYKINVELNSSIIEV